MKKKRVAFIIESSSRQNKAPAHLFFRGPNSRWINHVLDYMEVRDFPNEHIYFLSFYNQRIISYTEEIFDYPKSSRLPSKKEQRLFAEKIMDFIASRYENDYLVEIHTERNIYSELTPLLEEKSYSYRIFAEGEALGSKHKPYIKLIEEETALKRIKEMQQDKLSVVSLLEYRSPKEAQKAVKILEPKAAAYGIEDIIEEIKYLLKKHFQKNKDASRARIEFEKYMSMDKESKRYMLFFKQIKNLSDLTENLSQYEQIKSNCGRTVAKLTRFLIKQSYVQQMENKINEALLRLQIALLK
ncbi:hypothetical protein [Aneurinibacillus migulanus]|uniref:hypothetical protein n=1 Tax=Aneurinibacillus migulanus TaxID=47500 RepID=UPI00209CC4B5|nr:hypothetical protein [Aneurinibacillus migulanus]MCP1359301.1 hypothetical protein [Aneurinibacillus migulanus]